VSGSESNRQAGDWTLARLRQAGWETFTDEGSYRDTPVRNIAARKGQGPVILLGAHYDSRRCADQSQGGCAGPVLGANDGASGVAVLLELARSLDVDWSKTQVWLVFFDAEDNGGLDGWDWIVVSTQFAHLVHQRMAEGTVFRAMILLYMVGDRQQKFTREAGSDAAVQSEIWQTAARLGYGDVFLDQPMGAMIDDHVPFRSLGIPAVDIIGWPYAYWHTGGDTLDKLGADSLERIGRTLETWLEDGASG
jgi:glutaminyl-peptide cyclotransferase